MAHRARRRRGSAELELRLSGEWAHTPAAAGDRLSVIGALTASPVEISRESGLLLALRPETLVTGTALAGACGCARRGVLSRQRKAGEAARKMTMGTLGHAVFERLLRGWRDGTALDDAACAAAVDGAIGERLSDLLAVGVDEGGARAELKAEMTAMRNWVSNYLPAGGNAAAAAAVVEGSERGMEAASAACGLPAGRLRLRGVLSTEQLLASRTYGLKGQPDAEVSAELVTGHNTVVAEVPLPFDLKTGKRTGHNAIVHEAQLLVYSLLLSEKHGTRVPAGVLFYPQRARAAVAEGSEPVAADASHIASRSSSGTPSSPAARRTRRPRTGCPLRSRPALTSATTAPNSSTARSPTLPSTAPTRRPRRSTRRSSAATPPTSPPPTAPTSRTGTDCSHWRSAQRRGRSRRRGAPPPPTSRRAAPRTPPSLSSRSPTAATPPPAATGGSTLSAASPPPMVRAAARCSSRRWEWATS